MIQLVVTRDIKLKPLASITESWLWWKSLPTVYTTVIQLYFHIYIYAKDSYPWEYYTLENNPDY